MSLCLLGLVAEVWRSMENRDRGGRRMLWGLVSDSHLMPLERMPVRVFHHAAAAGLRDVLIYLTDLQQSVLRLLSGPGFAALDAAVDADPEMPVAGTMAGRAFQSGAVIKVREGTPSRQWWVPLLDGTERLGVLRVSPEHEDDTSREDCEALAAVVALMVVSKRDHSDAHARLVRTRAMNVTAEMQWNLMPPRTYADSRVVIGATMEPAYQISGDAFEYATSGHRVNLAMFDAMGHDTGAGLTANLAMAACRNHRRQGGTLESTGPAIEKVLLEQFGGNRYATAVLAELDTRTGLFEWVSHGHHPPAVIRGGRWVAGLRCPPGHPLGTDLGVPATVCRESLQPGDRVVLYTDGITEAGSSGGQEFGLGRFMDFLVRQHADGLNVPETLRRLTRSILAHHRGRLDDDATVLLLEWHGPRPYEPGEAEALTGLPGRQT